MILWRCRTLDWLHVFEGSSNPNGSVKDFDRFGDHRRAEMGTTFMIVTSSEECPFPTERWAATFRSLNQLIPQEIATGYDSPSPILGEILYREAKQPALSRLTLLEEVNAELCCGSPA